MKKILFLLMIEYLTFFLTRLYDSSFAVYVFFVCWSFLNLLIIPPLLIKISWIRWLYLFLWAIFFLLQVVLFILNSLYPKGDIPSELILLFTVHSVPALFKYHSNYLPLIFLFVVIKILYNYVQKRGQVIFCAFSKKVFIVFSLLNILAVGCCMYTHGWDFIKHCLSIFTYVESVDFSEYEKYGAHYPFSDETTKIEAKSNRNLIYIILESTEKNFIDNELFPNLCPSLQKYAREGIVAENMDMAHNSTLTFGGIYSSFSGKWLSPYSNKNNIFLKSEGNSVSFPLILQKAGYEQVFVYGHKNVFGGFQDYLEKQGFQVKRVRTKDQKYEADAKVFSEALKELKRLSKTDKPFNLTVLTVNTHGPNGLIFEDMELLKYSDPRLEKSRFLDVMHTTDAALGRFLEEVSKLSNFKDTTIVIQSDHLAHPFTNEVVLNRLLLKPRHMLFMILNSVKQKRITHPALTFDIAPTILSAMGARHNVTFLFGEDLFKDEVNPRRLFYSDKQERINSYYFTPSKMKKISVKREEDKSYLLIDGDAIPMMDFETQQPYQSESNSLCLLPISFWGMYTSVMYCYNSLEEAQASQNSYILYGSSGEKEQSLLDIKIPPHSTYLIFKKDTKNILHHIVPFDEQVFIDI